MKKLTTIFYLALLSSTLISCASKSKNQRLLNERAEYKKEVAGIDLNLGVKRTAARVTRAWVFPHELPTGDYFLGGWIMLKYGTEAWSIESFNKKRN